MATRCRGRSSGGKLTSWPGKLVVSVRSRGRFRAPQAWQDWQCLRNSVSMPGHHQSLARLGYALSNEKWPAVGSSW